MYGLFSRDEAIGRFVRLLAGRSSLCFVLFSELFGLLGTASVLYDQYSFDREGILVLINYWIQDPCLSVELSFRSYLIIVFLGNGSCKGR